MKWSTFKIHDGSSSDQSEFPTYLGEGTKYTSENVTPDFSCDLRILTEVHVFSQETSATSGF